MILSAPEDFFIRKVNHKFIYNPYEAIKLLIHRG